MGLSFLPLLLMQVVGEWKRLLGSGYAKGTAPVLNNFSELERPRRVFFVTSSSPPLQHFLHLTNPIDPTPSPSFFSTPQFAAKRQSIIDEDSKNDDKTGRT